MPDIFVPPSPASPPVLAPKTSLMAQAFSAFLLQPRGIHFETQSQQESIVLLLRRHIITNFPWLFIGAVLLVIPLAFFPVSLITGTLPTVIPPGAWVALFLIWYLFTSTYVLVNFLLWYFSVSILTTERIIDIDFSNILYKEFSATTIEKIEDVTDRRGGFFGVLFDYGDVVIQTAGTEEEFDFMSVPHPDRVVRIVNELMERESALRERQP